MTGRNAGGGGDISDAKFRGRLNVRVSVCVCVCEDVCTRLFFASFPLPPLFTHSLPRAFYHPPSILSLLTFFSQFIYHRRSGLTTRFCNNCFS